MFIAVFLSSIAACMANAQSSSYALPFIGLIDMISKDKELPLYELVGYDLNKDVIKSKSQEIENLNLKISKHRDSAVLYLQRGILRKYLLLNEAAIQDFNSAIKYGITRTNTEVYLYFTRAAVEQGYRSLALSVIDKYLRANPDSSKGYLYKGIALTYTLKMRGHSFRSRCEDSIPEFTAAIQKDSTNVLAYILRAHAHHALKNYDRSIADYNRSIDLMPQHAALFFLIGNVYEDMGKKDLACSSFRQANALSEVPKRFIERNCQ